MSPRVRVRATLPVAVTPEVAWERFSDVTSWRVWDWMGMADAVWLAGEPWQRGSALRVGHRPFTFDCEVAFCDPPFEVVWTGAGAGIDARHAYRFLPHARGALVVSDETFDGPAARAILPLVRWYWRRHLLAFRAWAEEDRPR
jgi:hypothetical protein